MAVLKARIYASVYGTASELAASTKVLGIGERWYRTDAPVVTDNTSPFFGLKDPAKQFKTGDGTKTWVQIANYDPAGGGSGSGTIPDLNPLTVLANIGEEGAPGSSLLIIGDDTTPEDTPTLANIMGALTQGHYNALSGMIGTLTEAEINGGGLRNIINTFMAIRPVPGVNVTGTISSTVDPSRVQLSAPLDSRVGLYARVFVNSGGTGIANPAYIGSIATDRMSFTLTASMYSAGTPTPLLATASGSRSLTIRDSASSQAFGFFLNGLVSQNTLNGIYELRSTPLPATPALG